MQRVLPVSHIARSFFVLCLLLPVVVAEAGTFDELDKNLQQGDLDTAKQQIEKMFKTASIVTSRSVVTLQSYEKVLKTLQSTKKFQDIAGKFETSEKTTSEFSTLRYSYNEFRSAWSAMPKNLPVSKELVALLNSTSEATRQKIVEAETQHKEVESQRKQALEAERESKRQAREDAEKKRLADADAERKKEEVAERAKANAHNAKINAINDAAVKAGYKGINKKYGVGRFLYHASKDGSLESGLNEIFWVKLSERDQQIDQKWRLSQVVDGWEIYEIRDWSGEELVHLSIAVKAKGGLPIEGQRLKGDYYVFRGNMQFKTVAGAMRIVQKFEQVALDVGTKDALNVKK